MGLLRSMDIHRLRENHTSWFERLNYIVCKQMQYFCRQVCILCCGMNMDYLANIGIVCNEGYMNTEQSAFADFGFYVQF